MARGKDVGIVGKEQDRPDSDGAATIPTMQALTTAEATGKTVQRGVGKRVQVRAIRRDGWTTVRRRRFMKALAETCNVSEAARVAGKCVASARNEKRRDPGFAREWDVALCTGYDELETILLREALFGSEQEEVLLDGEGVVKSRKIKRGRNGAVALRLLAHHRETVTRLRAQEMRERPDGADAVARLRTALVEVRGRTVLALSGTGPGTGPETGPETGPGPEDE